MKNKNADPNHISNYFKVPGRQVYCATRWQWFLSVLRCHIWLPIKLTFRPLPSIG